MNLIEHIRTLYGARGNAAYFGERVSMTEHGLQAAYFAQLGGAAPALVVAALLHDIGHLLEEVPDELSDWTSDAHHEQLGARWLARYLRPEVCEPVRLHVAAKRYLCAVDARYLNELSSASVHTLKLQGGAMPAAEVANFESEPYFNQAVSVRRWDDAGKVAGLATPPFDEYLQLIPQFLLRAA
jgi:[1-hydroxy-2-(trimethylamino)ethyl]phosphonate dioxygenase